MGIKHLVVISGPTASGKTALSVALAKRLKTCVLSADSRQFYREISIGTAKPSSEEMDGIPHYFIDSHSLVDEVTAAQFEREGLLLLDSLFREQDIVVLTGGSGMFVDALCEGLDEIPTSKSVRDTLQTMISEGKLDELLIELKESDPTYYDQVDRKNPARVMRAVEVTRITGKPYSDFRKASPNKRPFQVHRFVIEHERARLYERINQRVLNMIQDGLLEEVKSVHHLRGLSSLNTVGYSELFDVLDGKTILEEAISLIQQNSRRYAKRQITWLKRNPEAQWITFTSTDEMLQQIEEKLVAYVILE